MKILVTGGTGYIGKNLTEKLKSNHELFVVSRTMHKDTNGINYVQWDEISEIENIDIAINLAGENIGSSLWSKKKKEKILSSRLEATNKIKDFINSQEKPVKILIQSSAIGYYGYNNSENKDETSEMGDGFLAQVVDKWETAASKIQNVERHITVRFGMVYSDDSVLAKSLKPLIKLYLGAIPGNGTNYMSWIHLDELINAVLFLINESNSNGIYNIVRPKPETAEEFYQNMAEQLDRKIFFKIPSFLLKMFLGDFAKEIVLANNRCVPKRLLDAGFKF